MGFAPLAIDFVTDTLGRQIQFNYDGNLNLTSITAPGVGGTIENPVTRYLAQFDYQSRGLSYNFSGLTVENASYGQTLKTLRHVYFPVTNTGYLFTYSDYGMIYNVSLRRQMTIDGNGVISDGVDSATVSFNYPTSGTTQVSDVPAFNQRTESATGSPAGTYNYSTTTGGKGSQTMTFTVTRPDSSTLNLTRSTNSASVANGLLIQAEVKNSSGSSMSKSVLAYVNDPGGSPQVQSTINYDDGTPTPNQSKVDVDWDQYGNITNKREYGFQVSGSWLVRRRSRNLYKTDASYINAYLRNFVIETDKYDAQLDTNDGNDVLIAKSTFSLDDYAAMGGMEDYGGQAYPPGHLASYNTSVTVRGNSTGTTAWHDLANNLSITRLRKFDIFGNATKEQLACCDQQSYTRSEANYWAEVEVMTSGASPGPQQTATNVYDFNTSLLTGQTDPDNQTTTINYDQFLRPTSETLSTGATVTKTYNDQSPSMTTTTNYWDGGTYKTLTTSETYDGWLKVIQKVDTSGGQVNTSYDAMGRVQSVTNPFPQGGTPAPATTVQYDALGRRTIKTLPDNNTVQKAYNGNAVTLTDQVNRKTQQETDGLGRLFNVVEQDSSGALAQTTSYTYDYLDNLTLVNQGNQTRSFKYDALKRLLYERIPEQSATIWDGVAENWSMKYTYTDWGGVATRMDARGVVMNHVYDGLHRVTAISYNVPTGVASTSTVIYTYGTGTQLKSVGACNDFFESYAYDQYNRLSTTDRFIQGRHYQSAYQYNQINQRTQTSDPGGILSLQYDNQARITGVGSYLTNTNYNAAGQVTSFSLGNGVTENFGYDANRLQLITFNATAPGGPFGGLMQLSYVYQASAGQSGAGTTAGNAGQLTSMFGTIGGIPEGASYSYDLVNRLATSYTGTNNQSAYRRYAYDRWGNRTGVWDAVSGGNQIQSVALEQNGGVPTNRIQSVTAGGTVNYLYDAAGNVTNDGLHSYTYDAENRLVGVDGGATAQYLYDYKNRRILKQVGTAKTDYVWNEDQVIEEHDGGTSNAGALLVRYIYSGSDLIAKVEGGATRYSLRDKLSVRMTLDASGAVIGRQAHLPFGEDFAESGTQEKHHFTSYERDAESALDYAVNRIYSSSMARLLQTDPFRQSAHAVNPQSWNRYTYALSEPVNNVDPVGLMPEPPPLDDCGGIMEGIGGGQLPGLGYAQAYELVGPAYDKSGTKVVGWRYTPTCVSFLCGPRGDRIEKRKVGPFLQCLGATFIIPFPPRILCLGACFGTLTPGYCDVKPWPF